MQLTSVALVACIFGLALAGKLVPAQGSEAQTDGGLVGAPVEVSFNDPDVQEAYKALENRVNMMCLCIGYRKATSAEKVTKQVVNGIKYSFTNVNFYETDCTKINLPTDPNQLCQIQANTAAVSACSGDVLISPAPSNSVTVENLVCGPATVNSASAKGLVGAPETYTPSADDSNVLFAIGAINNMYKEQGDNVQRSLVEIVSATRQVVAGMLYKFTLKVAGQGKEICSVEVLEQAWVSTSPQLLSQPVCNVVEEAQQSLGDAKGSLGAPEPFTPPPDDVDVLFAIGAINNMYQEQGDNVLRSLLEIVSATRQVVAGTLYKFTLKVAGLNKEICTVEVLEQLWMTPSRQLQSQPVCNAEAPQSSERDGGAVGTPESYTPLPDDPKVLFAMGAINRMYQEKGDNVLRNLVEIISATKQVVAGTLYKFTLKVAGLNNEICNVELLDQPWSSPSPTLLSQPVCNAVQESVADQTKDLIGAPIVVSVSDADVAEAFKVLEKRVNLMSNSILYLSGGTPAIVTRQIVAGTKYVFTSIPFFTTLCQKNDALADPSMTCQATSSDPTTECSGEVFKSLGSPAVFSVNNLVCANPAVQEDGAVSPPENNNLVGAPEPYPATLDDPKVLFAMGAINNMYQEKGDNVQRNLVEIVSSTRQLVAGVLYKFSLKIAGLSNEICTVEVLDQPWLQPPTLQLVSAPVCTAATK